MTSLKKYDYSTKRPRKSKYEKFADESIDAYLLPLATLDDPFHNIKHIAMSGVEKSESNAVKKLIFEHFKAKHLINENEKFDDELMQNMKNLFKNFVIGNDYDETDDIVPIFPPNRNTLNGFKTLLGNRKRLIIASQRVSDVNIIPLLTRKKLDSSIKCVKCSSEQNNILTQTPTVSSKGMKLHLSSSSNNYFGNEVTYSTLPSCNFNESLQMAKCPKIKIESIVKLEVNTEQTEEISNNDNCSDENIEITTKCEDCIRTKVLYKDFQLLKKRFMSAFFWPVLLSTIIPDEIKIESVCENDNKKRKTIVRKRKHKKPWVTALLKKRHAEQNHTLKDSSCESEKDQLKKTGKTTVKHRQKTNLNPTRKSSRHAAKEREQTDSLLLNTANNEETLQTSFDVEMQNQECSIETTNSQSFDLKIKS